MEPYSGIIRNFTGGEISPWLYARDDLDYYPNSCRRMLNFVALPYGPATRRPPTRFIETTKTGTKKSRLLPFEFSASETQAYAIEIGDGYARFFKNKGQIVYVYNVAGGGNNGSGAIRLNIDADPVLSSLFVGATIIVKNVGGTTEANGTWLVSAFGNFYVDLQGSTFINTYTGGGTVTVIVEVQLPYTEGDLDQITLTQSADTLYLFHPAYQPRILNRLSHTSWSVDKFEFVDGPWLPETAVTIGVSGTSGNIILTWTGGSFNAGWVGRLIRYGGIATAWQASHAYSIDDIVRNGSGVYKCTAAGTSASSGGPSGTNSGIIDGTVSWDYQNAGGIQWGYVKITSFATTQTVNATVIKKLASTSPTSQRLGLYFNASSGEGASLGWPAAGIIDEQRLILGGSAGGTDRLDGSKVGAYDTFTPGTNDGDAYSYIIGSNQVNPIKWFATLSDLLIGTIGSECRAKGDTDTATLTPTNVNIKTQTRWGSAPIQPVQVGNVVVFATRFARKLRTLGFNWDANGYTAPELSARAEHITKGGIVDLTYQQEPWSILWMPRADGKLIGATYMDEQKVYGWHLHQLGANAAGAVVESVCAIPGATGDDLYMIVKRTIDGVTRRYVEVLEDFQTMIDLNTPAAKLGYADCSITYDGAPTDTLTGLDHLEGETVQVLADGAVHDDRVVTAGAITLDAKYSKVTVGYSCADASALEPMEFEATLPVGTIQTRRIDIRELGIKLYRSGAFYYGPDDNNLEIKEFRTGNMPMDTAVPLFTGGKTLDFSNPSDNDAPVDDGTEISDDLRMVFKPYHLLPLTIKALVPRYTAADME